MEILETSATVYDQILTGAYALPQQDLPSKCICLYSSKRLMPGSTHSIPRQRVSQFSPSSSSSSRSPFNKFVFVFLCPCSKERMLRPSFQWKISRSISFTTNSGLLFQGHMGSEASWRKTAESQNQRSCPLGKSLDRGE